MDALLNRSLQPARRVAEVGNDTARRIERITRSAFFTTQRHLLLEGVLAWLIIVVVISTLTSIMRVHTRQRSVCAIV